jgi:hypothetical protein
METVLEEKTCHKIFRKENGDVGIAWDPEAECPHLLTTWILKHPEMLE